MLLIRFVWILFYCLIIWLLTLQLNGAYPPGYYDLYSFDYYHGDHSYYANYPNNRVNTKRGNYERDGRTNSKEKDDKSKGKDEDKDKPPFQDEFVSLKKNIAISFAWYSKV